MNDMQVGIGASTAQEYSRAVKEAIEKARANIFSENINFALAFGTEKFSHPLVLQTITGILGSIPVLGANGMAVISGSDSLKHGLVIMLFCLPKDMHFSFAGADNISADSLSSGESLGERLLRQLLNARRVLSLVFTNTGVVNSQNFILGVQERIGKSFPMAGSLIISKPGKENATLSLSQGFINDGAWGILWGGKLNFSIVTKHGWQPLGKPRRVTKSADNLVSEIDGKPAVDLFREYFAKDDRELINNIQRLRTYYPLGISIEGEKEIILRSIVSVNPDGSIAFMGDIPEGSVVRLMIASKESCLASTQEAAKETLKNMGKEKIKFALILNSLSRLSLLGRMANQEIKILKSALGEGVPFAGIYASTGHGPLNSMNYLGKNYFHNNSITILALS